jgi:tetratricopeptide (TPR) repeat protein
MLQTIREYGLERLQECGEANAFQKRHATYFADLAERLEGTAWEAGPGSVFMEATSNWDNVRAALDWSQAQPEETETCLRLISALTALWAFGGHSAEGYVRAENILARPDAEQYPAAWAGALITMGALHEMRGESGRAVEALVRCEEILRRIGDDGRLSGAVQWLGITAMSHGDLEGALRQFTESRDLARTRRLPWTEATALSFLAEVMVAHDDLDQVRAVAEDAEARYRMLRDPWGLGRVQKLLAGIAWLEGDYAAAHRLCEQAIPPLRAAGERWNLARTLTRMGIILFDEAQYGEAEETLIEALLAWQSLRNDGGMVLSLAGIAAVAAARGQIDRAAYVYAAEPFHGASRAPVLDTLSGHEYEHLTGRIREGLGERSPHGPVIPLEDAVSYVLEEPPVAEVR